MYQFDISRLSPVDWFYWGMSGHYNLQTITYLIQKTALFDFASMPSSEYQTIGYEFGVAVAAYLEQFTVIPPDPPPLNVTNDDIKNLFRRIIGEGAQE